jgi:GNAT superfamily N-acetyltransferase
MTPDIREYDGPNQTPAVALIARAWPEMLTNGTAAPELIGNWDHQAIVHFIDGVATGLITYEHVKYRKMLWIHLGYVAPEFRGRGIYRLLWTRLIAIAQKLGAVQIQGGTHVGNASMLACAKALGRKELFITTQFAVPPVPKSRGRKK